LSFLVLAPAALQLATMALLGNTAWMKYISPITTLLFTPLNIGTAVYTYNIYLNIGDKWQSVFKYYRDKDLINTSYGLGIVNGIITLIIQLIPNIYTALNPGAVVYYNTQIFVSLLSLLLVCLTSVYLFLTPYIFMLNKEKTLMTIIKDSIIGIRGFVFKYIGFIISLVIIIILVLFVIGTALISMFLVLGVDINMIFVLFTSVIMFILTLFTPYIRVATSGYAYKLLNREHGETQQ